MIVRLSKDIERFIDDVVASGLYTRRGDVVRDALSRLRQTIPLSTDPTARASTTNRPDETNLRPVTPDALKQSLLAAGLVIHLPNPLEDVDDDDADDVPIELHGEPLPETIIRQRR